MTIKEINDHFNKKFRMQVKDMWQKDKDLLTATTFSIARYITEQPYKNAAIAQLVDLRSACIPRLFELGYITDKEILAIEKEYPEIYYSLPVEVYTKYPRVFEAMLNNQRVIYDLLPNELHSNERVQKAFKRDRKIYNNMLRDHSGYDIYWQDDRGNLIDLFRLKNNFPITSKEDYIKIAEIFLSSDMSVEAFCDVYGISSIKGFNELLSKLSVTNTSVKEALKVKKSEAQARYLEEIQDIAKKFNNGEIDFEKYMSSYYRSCHRFAFLIDNVEDKQKLVKQVTDYLSKYVDELNLKKLYALFDANIDDFIKTVRMYVKMVGIQDRNIDYLLSQIMSKYRPPYKRRNLKGTIIKDGMEYTIDDDIIDQAISYLRDHDISIRHFTVQSCVMKILEGKIDYSSEASEKKKELKEEILRVALSKAKSIEDYMAAMEETSTKQMKG